MMRRSMDFRYTPAPLLPDTLSTFMGPQVTHEIQAWKALSRGHLCECVDVFAASQRMEHRCCNEIPTDATMVGNLLASPPYCKLKRSGKNFELLSEEYDFVRR